MRSRRRADYRSIQKVTQEFHQVVHMIYECHLPFLNMFLKSIKKPAKYVTHRSLFENIHDSMTRWPFSMRMRIRTSPSDSILQYKPNIEGGNFQSNSTHQKATQKVNLTFIEGVEENKSKEKHVVLSVMSNVDAY